METAVPFSMFMLLASSFMVLVFVQLFCLQFPEFCPSPLPIVFGGLPRFFVIMVLAFPRPSCETVRCESKFRVVSALPLIKKNLVLMIVSD